MMKTISRFNDFRWRWFVPRCLVFCLVGWLGAPLLAQSDRCVCRAGVPNLRSLMDASLLAQPDRCVCRAGVPNLRSLPAAPLRVPPDQPNIILINLDDADVDLFVDSIVDAHLPNIGRLAKSGLRLTNCHVTTPLCGPSRTCLLLGQYAHRTGIKTNVASGPINNGFAGGFERFQELGHDRENVSVWMQRAGYRTMMIGKYLHGRVNPDKMPSWDDLHVSFGGKYFKTFYYSTQFPKWQRRKTSGEGEYRTTVEADAAVLMIQQQAQRNRTRESGESEQPFFLYLAPLAPHKPAAQSVMLPARYRELDPEIRLADTPDLNEADVADKPPHLQVDALTKLTLAEMEDEHRKRVATLKSVDDMLAKIFQVLEATDQADKTFIVLTSDHGYQLGHNRMIGKKMPFHRCTVIPMFISGPKIKPGRAHHLVSQLDLVPTFLELAGGQAPVELDGKSLVPLLENPSAVPVQEFRESLLIQNWEDKNQSGVLIPGVYASMRTVDQIYTEWSNGAREFYNLKDDPFQVTNRFDTLTPDQVREFSTQLHSLKQGDQQPLATIAGPTLVNKHMPIRGVAEDNNAVDQVEVQCYHPAQNRYWNGSAWQTDQCKVVATLSNPQALISDWQVALDLTKFRQDDKLEITAVAHDTEGNISEPFRSSLRVDSISPETELVIPAEGTTVKPLLLLYGTCRDNEMMQGIELSLENLDEQTFWDGDAWKKQKTTFFKRVIQERWHLRFEVPPGRYRATARALDRAGNYDETPEVREFIVK